MKKFILITSFLFLLSCTKETTIYIEKANFNNLTKLQIDQIDGIGEVKIIKIMNEFENGGFESREDFEERMKGKLSPEMILKIGDKYNFTAEGGT